MPNLFDHIHHEYPRAVSASPVKNVTGSIISHERYSYTRYQYNPNPEALARVRPHI
jgi:hypothetical protein